MEEMTESSCILACLEGVVSLLIQRLDQFRLNCITWKATSYLARNVIQLSTITTLLVLPFSPISTSLSLLSS